jgi:DNA-binding beta-propeller fold protein YncE
MYIKRNSIMIVKLLVFSITISLFAVISYIGLHSNNFFIQIYAKETLQESSKNNTTADENKSLFSINLYHYNSNTSKLETPLINLIQNISLPNVIGRMDHMDIDIKNNRLFVAELGNNSVDVIDLQNNGNRLGTITEMINEPQGIAYVSEYNKLFVSNGADGKVNVFNATSYKWIDSINFYNDADNIRYDNVSKLIYVGFGGGGIGIINATDNKLLKEIKLPSHPESFQIEKNEDVNNNKSSGNKLGKRIYVNTPEDNSISIIDLELGIVSSRWSLGDNGHNNFPMALDQSNHRLFVGTRDPPKLIVFDTNSMESGFGKVISKVNISKDSDDIFYDSKNKIIYISSGQGFIDIFKKHDANHYKLYSKIPTEDGARTSLFVPELKRIYLAVPKYDKGDSEAEILVYEIK